MRKSWLEAARIFAEESRRFGMKDAGSLTPALLAAHREYVATCSRRMREEAGWDFEEWRSSPTPKGDEAAYMQILMSTYNN